MDENSFLSNLKTLKEIVLDESRLVTYTSLSKELCVHVNEAKLLLSKALEDIRKKEPNINLNVNYIISGLLDEFKGQIAVCSESNLIKIKETFQTIFFHHIYSLSKGTSSLDKISLLAANKLEDLSLCTGLIKNSSCLIRTRDELGALKLHSQEIVNDLNINKLCQNNKQEVYKSEHKEVNVNATENGKNDKNKSNHHINIKKEISSPKKTLLGKNSFNKSDRKTSKSIEVFFNKIDTVSKSSNHKKNETAANDVHIKEETKVKEEMDVDNIQPEINDTDIIEANKSATKVSSTIKKKAKINKKRKRLLHVSDSESENEGEDPFNEKTLVNHESEDEIPQTPSINTIKITSGIVNPRKRRKLIDKVNIVDGYVITKKEEVYESCSENEEESYKKENVENNISSKTGTSMEKRILTKTDISPKEKKTKTKKKTPAKGNQTTIMNYFKKK